MGHFQKEVLVIFARHFFINLLLYEMRDPLGGKIYAGLFLEDFENYLKSGINVGVV